MNQPTAPTHHRHQQSYYAPYQTQVIPTTTSASLSTGHHYRTTTYDNRSHATQLITATTPQIHPRMLANKYTPLPHSYRQENQHHPHHTPFVRSTLIHDPSHPQYQHHPYQQQQRLQPEVVLYNSSSNITDRASNQYESYGPVKPTPVYRYAQSEALPFEERNYVPMVQPQAVSQPPAQRYIQSREIANTHSRILQKHHFTDEQRWAVSKQFQSYVENSPAPASMNNYLLEVTSRDRHQQDVTQPTDVSPPFSHFQSLSRADAIRTLPSPIELHNTPSVTSSDGGSNDGSIAPISGTIASETTSSSVRLTLLNQNERSVINIDSEDELEPEATNNNDNNNVVEKDTQQIVNIIDDDDENDYNSETIINDRHQNLSYHNEDDFNDDPVVNLGGETGFESDYDQAFESAQEEDILQTSFPTSYATNTPKSAVGARYIQNTEKRSASTNTHQNVLSRRKSSGTKRRSVRNHRIVEESSSSFDSPEPKRASVRNVRRKSTSPVTENMNQSSEELSDTPQRVNKSRKTKHNEHFMEDMDLDGALLGLHLNKEKKKKKKETPKKKHVSQTIHKNPSYRIRILEDHKQDIEYIEKKEEMRDGDYVPNFDDDDSDNTIKKKKTVVTSRKRGPGRPRGSKSTTSRSHTAKKKQNTEKSKAPTEKKRGRPLGSISRRKHEEDEDYIYSDQSEEPSKYSNLNMTSKSKKMRKKTKKVAIKTASYAKPTKPVNRALFQDEPTDYGSSDMSEN